MNRLPVLFVSHGAPTFAIEPGELGPRLLATAAALPRPRALLIVSPHWMTRGVRVSTASEPETVHDFGGFPAELYRIQYPAPGAPALARRAVALLREAGWPAEEAPGQGLDHGAWVPARHLYPRADVPVFQVSLPAGLDGAAAYRLGQALAPLRDEGVLIVGSGSLTHNLYEFRQYEDGIVAEYAREFAAWVRQAVEARDDQRLQRTMAIAPHAQRAHPTDEHFLPLLVAAGAAADDDTVRTLEGGILYGMLAMDSFVFGGAAAQA